jgi:hypothetical protein
MQEEVVGHVAPVTTTRNAHKIREQGLRLWARLSSFCEHGNEPSGMF